jgi:hypothetical protein
MLRVSLVTAVILLLFSGCYIPEPLNQHTTADLIVYIKNKNGEYYCFSYDTPSDIPDIHFYSRHPGHSRWYYWGDESLEKFVELFGPFLSN